MEENNSFGAVDSFTIEDKLNLSTHEILMRAKEIAKNRAMTPQYSGGLFSVKTVAIIEIVKGKVWDMDEDKFVNKPDHVTYTILVYGKYNEIPY